MSSNLPANSGFHQRSDAPTVGWVPSPDGRGTSSLVTTCIITLGLCVWSAIHLSIPKRGETSFQYLMRNVKWCIIGVFGPELVVFAAWRQYISARALSTEVNKRLKRNHTRDTVSVSASPWQFMFIRPEYTPYSVRMLLIWDQTQPSREKPPSAKKGPWSLTTGFYGGMGGFVFELDGPSMKAGAPIIDGFQRLTLTARGVALLAACGVVPDIQEDEIIDRNKTDGLAKFLACLQTGWMVVQVIARVHAGLPITLLEVNTMGHVFCAFIIYILWWYKPRWINVPTPLEGDWVRPMCAYMYLSSQLSGWNAHRSGLLGEFFVEPEISALAFVPAELAHKYQPQGQTTVAGLPEDIDTALSSTSYFMAKPRVLKPGQDNCEAEVAGALAHVQTPSQTQLERWRMAAEAVDRFPQIRARFTRQLDSLGKKNADALRLYPEMPANFVHTNEKSNENSEEWLECSAEQLLTECAANWPGDDLLRGVAGLMMGAVLWFASMAFGGVHAAAWDAYFPSPVEAWMWRCSALYISFSGLLWLAANMLAQFSRRIWWYWYELLMHQVHWINYAIWGTVCTICGSAYIFARLFLVVEAFISLRALPIAAYSTPNWTLSIPHF